MLISYNIVKNIIWNIHNWEKLVQIHFVFYLRMLNSHQNTQCLHTSCIFPEHNAESVIPQITNCLRIFLTIVIWPFLSSQCADPGFYPQSLYLGLTWGLTPLQEEEYQFKETTGEFSMVWTFISVGVISHQK